MHDEMTLQIGRLFEMNSETAAMFVAVEPRPWDVRALCVELVAEYGSLAHHVMDYGGYKLTSRYRREHAEDECSDVVFVLLRLLEMSDVHSPPEATLDFDPPEFTQTPEELFLNAVAPIPLILDLAGTPAVRAPIMKAVTELARLASSMRLRSLECVHHRTMRRTQAWIQTRKASGRARRMLQRLSRFICPRSCRSRVSGIEPLFEELLATAKLTSSQKTDRTREEQRQLTRKEP